MYRQEMAQANTVINIDNYSIVDDYQLELLLK